MATFFWQSLMIINSSAGWVQWQAQCRAYIQIKEECRFGN